MRLFQASCVVAKTFSTSYSARPRAETRTKTEPTQMFGHKTGKMFRPQWKYFDLYFIVKISNYSNFAVLAETKRFGGSFCLAKPKRFGSVRPNH